MKYRKKPVVVEAWQWTGGTAKDALDFCSDNGLPDWRVDTLKGKTGLIIPTLEGDRVASCGDYIIKGVHGEYYPCKPDIFEKTYEDAECKDLQR